MMVTILLITFISHLTGDFILQTDNIARGRDSSDYKGFKRTRRSFVFNLVHCGIHGFLIYILIYLTKSLAQVNIEFSFLLILLISLMHFFIDMLKPFLISLPERLSFLINKLFTMLKLGSYNAKVNKNKISFNVFIVDQLLHICSIIMVFKLLYGIKVNTIYNFIKSLPNSPNVHDKVLAVILILIFSTFGAAYFSKSLLDSMKNDCNIYTRNGIISFTKEIEPMEEARNGGFSIGILERIFIILGILMNHPSVIPIVLTVKSIARYKKFSNDSFVEYYIIGTFFSFVVAIIGGLIIVKII